MGWLRGDYRFFGLTVAAVETRSLFAGSAVTTRMLPNTIKELSSKHEADLSTEQSTPEADSRISCAHGNARRQKRPAAAAPQGPLSADGLDPGQTARLKRWSHATLRPEDRLHRRSEYLQIQRSGVHLRTRHFVVYVARIPGQPQPRLGLTVSRAVGKAVTRNRIKRRVRESFRLVLRQALPDDGALVVIARAGAGELGTDAVTAEVKPAVLTLVKKVAAG
jgi:ribonuclease P protein component